MKEFKFFMFVLIALFTLNSCDLGNKDDTKATPSGDTTPAGDTTPVAVIQDFESYSVADVLLHYSYDGDTATAVADDPITTGNNVLKVGVNTWNTGAVVTLEIPTGKTLADYTSLDFNAYYESGDLHYKDYFVFAFSETADDWDYSGTDAITETSLGTVSTADQSTLPAEAWSNISIDITDNASTLTGTVYLVLGFNGDTSVYYLDDVTLVE